LSRSDSSSPRTPGYDVARALAVLGMVMVDLRHELLSYDGARSLLWLFDGIEGKAAAMFVVLAGAGLSLRTRHRDEDDGVHVDRRPLVERALLLIGLGLLLMHVWEYDILHFHGVYLLLAIPLLRVRSATLWLFAAAAVWIAMVLATELDWHERPTLTPSGSVRHLFFNGLYPVFPWIAFLLVGMAVGRLDLANDRVRKRALLISLAAAIVAFAIDSVGRWEQHTGALGLGNTATWLLTWPRAPRPLFVVSGCGIAVALVCICIGLTQQRAHRRWVMALVATGQLTFSIYVAHVIAILVPLQHGFLRGRPIELTLAFALLFYVVAIAFAVWWRRRWQHGPLEGLLRQVTSRERLDPAPGTALREG